MRWLTRPLATLALCAVAACASPPVMPTEPALSPRGMDQSGRFRLVFDVPKTVWSTDEQIDGLAALHLLDESAGVISGPGYIGFTFAQADGSWRLEPAWTDNCTARALASDAPFESRILQTGAALDTFGEMFLRDPHVRLPAGVWEITATADFYEGPSCVGPRHRLSATVRLQVNN